MKIQETDPLRSFVDQILASSDRAASLTRSLLTFSRKQISNLMPMDVNESISKVKDLLIRVIGEDIDLRTTLAPGDLLVNADSGQIEQVLMNLATNARDAMPNGGLLSIETGLVRPKGIFEKLPAHDEGRPYVLISVTDTGVGMNEKIRDKIFEPFFTTKDLWSNVGLGLSVTYRIVSEHGGRIEVSSTPGQGSTFVVALPAAAKPTV
jgi:signal transduction histidine kinase